MHNFCPIPDETTRQQASPDIFSLSALDEQQRLKAVKYTQRTIQTAARLKAQAVVLHLGKVQAEEKIRELADYHSNNDREGFKQLKRKMISERKIKSRAFFLQALKSLNSLVDSALKQGVKLGIENRYYFNEIPSLEEMDEILNNFPSPPLYYWHDVGHAQVYENLEFLDHKTILDKFASRMLGMHLHDIEAIDDHRAPLQGKFDFAQLKPYVHKGLLMVLEPHQPASAAQIIKARQYLTQLFTD